MDKDIQKLESQIVVIERLLIRQPEVKEDGTFNSKHFALKGKLNQLKIKLENLKWKEYEAK